MSCGPLVTTGTDDAEELAGQLATDLLEADGYTVQYAGGGVANDELVAQIGASNIDRLVVFRIHPRHRADHPSAH